MKFCTILLVAALTYGSVAKNLKGGQGALKAPDAPWGNYVEGEQSMVCEGPSGTTCTNKETKEKFGCCHGPGGSTVCIDGIDECATIGGKYCLPKIMNGMILKGNDPPFMFRQQDCSGIPSVTSSTLINDRAKKGAFASRNHQCLKNKDCMRYLVNGVRRDHERGGPNGGMHDHICCPATDDSNAETGVLVCMTNLEVEGQYARDNCFANYMEGFRLEGLTAEETTNKIFG